MDELSKIERGAIAELAAELMDAGEREAAHALIEASVEALRKSADDQFVAELESAAKTVAAQKGIAFEHSFVHRGTERNHLFKVGGCEVEHSRTGRLVKVDVRRSPTATGREVALAKAIAAKIQKAYAGRGEALVKNKVNQNRGRDGKFSYDGKHDRECARCGNAFGKHLAAAPHPIEDASVGECKGFKPAKKAKAQPADLAKAKVDDVFAESIARRLRNRGHSERVVTTQKENIKSNRRIDRRLNTLNDPYTIPRHEGIPRTQRTQPKLPGGRDMRDVGKDGVPAGSPEMLDKAKIDTYHFGETGKKGYDLQGAGKAAKKATYRARRQFRDPHVDRPGVRGMPEWHGTIAGDFAGENKDPLSWPVGSAVGPRTGYIPNPKLPGGHPSKDMKDGPRAGDPEMLDKADRIPGGKADNRSPSEFPRAQMKAGQKHEMEHTNDPAIAREIASDHLAEDRRYYTKLNEIEKGRVKRENKALKGKWEEHVGKRVRQITGNDPRLGEGNRILGRTARQMHSRDAEDPLTYTASRGINRMENHPTPKLPGGRSMKDVSDSGTPQELEKGIGRKIRNAALGAAAAGAMGVVENAGAIAGTGALVGAGAGLTYAAHRGQKAKEAEREAHAAEDKKLLDAGGSLDHEHVKVKRQTGIPGRTGVGTKEVDEIRPLKKGDVTSMVGRKRREDPPAPGEGASAPIAGLLAPIAHREAAEFHVRHLAFHNSAQKLAEAKGDREKAAAHDRASDLHYAHALSHAKRFNEGKHWVAFMQGHPDLGALPEKSYPKEFTPHEHDHALGGRIVDHTKLGKSIRVNGLDALAKAMQRRRAPKKGTKRKKRTKGVWSERSKVSGRGAKPTQRQSSRRQDAGRSGGVLDNVLGALLGN